MHSVSDEKGQDYQKLKSEHVHQSTSTQNNGDVYPSFMVQRQGQ